MDLKLGEFTIPDGAPLCSLGALRQIMLFAANDDSRPALCSVHVTRTYLEAADGFSACRVFTEFPEDLATRGVPEEDQGLMLYLPDLKALRGYAQDPVKIVQIDWNRDTPVRVWVAVGRAIWEVRTNTQGTYPDVGGIFAAWARTRGKQGPGGEIVIDPVFYPRIQALAKALQKTKDARMAAYMALAAEDKSRSDGPPPALVAIGPVRKEVVSREIYAYCLVMPLFVKDAGLEALVTGFVKYRLWKRVHTEEEPEP